jgi:hypothetical protein
VTVQKSTLLSHFVRGNKDRLHRKLELFSVALGCKIKYEARLCAKALSRF